MPRDFSELVAEVTERNKRNREAQWNQVAPYLGAMVQKAQYEVAKQKSYKETAEGLSAYAQQEGIGFKPVMIGDNYADVNVQQMAFNKSIEDTKPDLAWKAYSSIYGIPMPENYKDMTPEQKTVSLAKARDEFAITESINNTIIAYPEIEAQLKADPKFATATPQQKQAIFNRVVTLEEAKRNMAMSLSKKQQEMQMDVQKYWQTTGATAAQRLQFDKEKEAGNTSNLMANAVNTINELKTNGMNFGNHTVKIIDQQIKDKNNNAIKTLPTAEVKVRIKNKIYHVRKTNAGIYLWNGTAWNELKLSKKGEGEPTVYAARGKGDNVTNIPLSVVKSLNDGYDLYEKESMKATGKVVNAVQEQEQQTTYSEFDDIFK